MSITGPKRDNAGANFHTVWMSIEILLIECKGCNRRAALGKEELPAIHRGNQDYVRNVKFKCEKCGAKEVRSYIPISREEVAMFLAGDWLHESRRVI